MERLTLDDLDAAAARVVSVLRAGGLAVVPTDTVYAVVADAFQPVATTRVFAAKQRARALPLPVVIRSPRQVSGLVADVPEAADRLMASYWPGPLTLVFRVSEGLTWELGDSAGTVALRLPTDELLLAVAREIGPLACTAANRTGLGFPTTVEEAQAQLADAVELYVDAGTRAAPASTVVDVSRGEVAVLREGAVPAEHVQQVASGGVPWGARPGAGEVQPGADDRSPEQETA